MAENIYIGSEPHTELCHRHRDDVSEGAQRQRPSVRTRHKQRRRRGGGIQRKLLERPVRR